MRWSSRVGDLPPHQVTPYTTTVDATPVGTLLDGPTGAITCEPAAVERGGYAAGSGPATPDALLWAQP